MKKILACLAIIFFMSACGNGNKTKTTTCTNDLNGIKYEATYKSNEDKVSEMKENLKIPFDYVGEDEDSAKTYVENIENTFKDIEGVTISSNIDKKEKIVDITLTIDFENAKSEELMSAGVFNEELLKETDGKKYPSLKAIVEANEEGGQTCKDK